MKWPSFLAGVYVGGAVVLGHIGVTFGASMSDIITTSLLWPFYFVTILFS